MKKINNILIGILLLLVTITVFFGIAESLSRLIYGHNLVYSYGGPTLWSLQPNQEAFTIPNHKFAHINSNGLRGKNFSIEKEDGTFRILMLGDSYMFGYGLSDNETLPFQLQELLNTQEKKFEVINTGIPGYGIFQMVNFYKEEGFSYNFDLVILMAIEEDLLRQPLEEGKWNLRYYLKNMVRVCLRKSTFIAIMKPRFERMRWIMFGDLEEMKERYEELWGKDKKRLEELAVMLLNQNKSLVLVPYIEHESELGFRDKMKDFSAEHRHVFVVDNVYEKMEEFGRLGGKELLMIEGDGHPTAIANQITAQLIYEKLIKNNLITIEKDGQK